MAASSFGFYSRLKFGKRGTEPVKLNFCPYAHTKRFILFGKETLQSSKKLLN